MKFWLLLLMPGSLLGHMVSMSTGEVTVTGNRAVYELKIPAYEAAHASDPERALLENIHFRDGREEGRRTSTKCETSDATFHCTAVYEFPAAPDVLNVDCTFAAVTVPNHVHVLRAYRGDKSDQAVFDISYTSAELRFRPPGAWEVFVRESGAGFVRAVFGVAPLLFLLSLALAARSWREVLLLGASLLMGECIACLAAPWFVPAMSPRFLEAAAALTVAYLAFEILLLPDAGQRWAVCGVLGLFHGAYLSMFLISSGYRAVSFLLGVFSGEVAVVAVLFPLVRHALRRSRPPVLVPAAAGLLMATGLVWFALRVWV